MENDDELNEIRRRKMEELSRSSNDQQLAEQQRQAQELERAKRQQVLRQILSPEARDRLSNVRLVRPDLAENVENQLIQLANMGRVNRLLTDTDIKDILSKFIETKRETKIERRDK